MVQKGDSDLLTLPWVLYYNERRSVVQIWAVFAAGQLLFIDPTVGGPLKCNALAQLDNQVPDVIYIIYMGQLRLEISNEAHAEALRQARLAGLELRQYLRAVLEEAIEKRRIEQGKTKKS